MFNVYALSEMDGQDQNPQNVIRPDGSQNNEQPINSPDSPQNGVQTIATKDNNKRKSVKKWVLLLVLPLVLLIIVALLQIIVHFVLAKSSIDAGVGVNTATTSSISTTVLTMISFIVGSVSVIALVPSPLWIVFLVRDLKGNARTKTTAVVLAVFFGLFSWLYTYEKNGNKFWINLGLCVITVGYWSPVAWLWAVIDNANKPNDFYTHYDSLATTVA